MASEGSGSGFSIRPDDLRQGGDHLHTFGDNAEGHHQQVQSSLGNLGSKAGKDRSGIGSVITKGVGQAGEAMGGFMKELTRVVRTSGDNLHSSANSHEKNEADTTKSFNDLHPDKNDKPYSTPKGGGDTPKAGPHGNNGHGPSAKDYNKNPETNSTPNKDRPTCGDPVDVSTGRVLIHQVDLELGGALPLVLTRTHVTGYLLGRSFGPSWACTMDQFLEFDGDGVSFAAEDGTVLSFPRPALGAPTEPVLGPRWQLVQGEDGSYAIGKPELDVILWFMPGPANRYLLRAVVDGSSHVVWFDRDEAGTPVGVRHSGGYAVRVSSAGGRVTGLDLDGAEPIEVLRYQYDARGNLSDVVNSSGRPLRFRYDEDGRVVQWRDRNEIGYQYRFDTAGRCVAATGAGGLLGYRFAYAEDTWRTRVTDSLGHTSVFDFNPQGQLLYRIDPLGRATAFEWDDLDRLCARTDPLGRTTRYEYDGAGNLCSVIQPDGSTTRAVYAEDGLSVQVTEPDGARWRREYSTSGRLAAEVDPTGARTSYTYDDAHHLAAVTDALGNTTRFTCNAAGLLLTSTDPQGARTQYAYDAFGRVSTVSGPREGTVHHRWTIEGLPLESTTAGGATHRYRYDGEGNLRQTVDPQGRISRTTVDHFDVPTVLTAADGTELRYDYDTELRVIRVTNQQGQTWQYHYDPAGQLVGETDFDGREHHYRYDAAGQLVEQTNALGQTVRIGWDRAGRMASRAVDGALTTFGYDPAGRLRVARTRSAARTTELRYAYDSLGRVVAETVDGRTLHSSYDAVGRRTARTTPTGVASSWTYDPADQPSALHTGGHTLAFRRDEAGREVARTFGAATVTQTWDTATHRPSTQTLHSNDNGANPVRLHGYTYRPDGTLTATADPWRGTHQYVLDPLDRVIAVDGPGWTERYSYDATGNLTVAHWPGGTEGAAAGSRSYLGTRLTQAGAVRYEHDREGRVTARHTTVDGATRTWHYAWDGQDQLTDVHTPEGQHWRYLYDPIGRRSAKQRLTPDGTVAEHTTFTWDGGHLAEQTHNNTDTHTWEWQPETHRPLTQSVHTRTHDGHWAPRSVHTVLTDPVGTPTDLVDPAGTLAWHATATLWGNHPQGPAATPLRFPGQYHDPETGLHYNYFRYYDPTTARYTSHDPLGLDPAPNTLAYVPNPTTWIDPLGLAPCDNYDFKHNNPDGKSLRIRGPRNTPNPTRTPNKVRDQDLFDNIKNASGNPNPPKEKISFHRDPQTIHDTSPQGYPGLSRDLHQAAMNNGRANFTDSNPQAIENMGRNDFRTRPYWEKQDRRDQQVAADAARLHGENRPPSILVSPPDKTHANIGDVQNMLKDHDGVVIGGTHTGDGSHWPFLTNNMAELKNSGVDKIYSETIRQDGHQHLVNEFMHSPAGSPMPSGLNRLMAQNPGMQQTLEAAKQHGVDVQGIDGRPGRRPADLVGDQQLHARASLGNTYMSQSIQNHQESNPGKYVAEVGSAHVGNHAGPPGGVKVYGSHLPQNFPGVEGILGVPGIMTSW